MLTNDANAENLGYVTFNPVAGRDGAGPMGWYYVRPDGSRVYCLSGAQACGFLALALEAAKIPVDNRSKFPAR